MRSASGRAAALLGTWFGCGHAPVAPGTVGSLGGLAVAALLGWRFGWEPLHFLALAAVFTIPAIWASGVVARQVQGKDPGLVVVDEVVGQWVALAGASVLDWKSLAAAFVLFRFFDVVKPPPARQLESLPGGIGIVADDLMAGVYAALVLYAARWFNLY
ncbi:MAG: phosphatidylglycerophosphatase A [Bryobacteraceae bacterium]